MPWERPISFEDELNSWEDELFAYDEDNTTWAKSMPMPTGIWTGWLVFTWPQFVAQQFAGEISYPIPRIDLELEAWTGLEWKRWLTLINAGGWTSITFYAGPGVYTKVRLRWRHNSAGWHRLSLNDVRIDRTCRGPLVAVCGFFGQAAEFFDDLADDIEDVFIIGEHLAGPFRALAGFFTTASNLCCIASSNLQEILDLLPGGITWDEISALILEHWPTLAALISDPVGWFLVQLTLAFDLEPWHTQSLEFLAKWVLQTYFPTLWNIWWDPAGWIQEHVLPLIEGLPDWLTDPVGWLRAVIEQTFPTLVALANDPVGWFLVQLTLAFDLEPWHTQSLEFLAKWVLQTYFPTLWDIWFDPGLWIQEHVLSLIPELPDFLADPEAWLRETLERLFGGLVEFLEKWLDLLLEFLQDPSKWLGDRFIAWVVSMTPLDEVYEQQKGTFNWGDVITTALTESEGIEDIIAPYMEEEWID